MDTELDLFASQASVVDIPKNRRVVTATVDLAESKALSWYKLNSGGFRPASREGHTAVPVADDMFVFGGYEGPQRVNTTLRYNAPSDSWSMLSVTGEEPPPRAYHASCSHEQFLIIHGGEMGTLLSSAQQDPSRPQSNSGSVQSDVCLDDHMGAAMVSTKVSFGSTRDGIKSVCLDDMYVLNTASKEWRKVISSLAPLPRKGHTVVTAKLRPRVSEDRVHMVVLFGGYSSNKDIFSSSIHVCSWEDITLSAKAVWRNLQTTGSSPIARYRHSACVVPSGNNKTREDLLVIHGGIGDGNTPLADINVLDFGSLAWSTLSNPADGSVPNPVYGHCAVPSKSVTNSDTIIIFGGSLDPQQPTGSLARGVYEYDLSTHSYRIVKTGFLYPTSRVGHSACLITGWSPTEKGTTPQITRPSVIIYGGMNSIMVNSDVWALDLTWQDAGVGQLSDSITCAVSQALLQAEIHDTSDTEPKHIFSSQTLSSELNSTNNISVPEDTFNITQIQSGLTQLKRERALAEIQLAQERTVSSKLKEINDRLLVEVEELKKIIQDNECLYEKDLSVLRNALTASVAKTRELESLNEEAYTLLMLQSSGIKEPSIHVDTKTRKSLVHTSTAFLPEEV